MALIRGMIKPHTRSVPRAPSGFFISGIGVLRCPPEPRRTSNSAKLYTCHGTTGINPTACAASIAGPDGAGYCGVDHYRWNATINRLLDVAIVCSVTAKARQCFIRVAPGRSHL